MRINEDYAQYFDNRGLLDHDYQVDESYDHRKGKSSRRIDLLMLDSQKWTAIEIKISRSDFYRDTEEKRRAWKTHTHRFIYATPQGLITAEVSEMGDAVILLFIQPRRGVYMSYKVWVTEEDEPKVREYLNDRWELMKRVWEPISQPIH